MKLDPSELDNPVSQQFEKRVQKFAHQALILLKEKGMTPRESLRAILGDSKLIDEFRHSSWLIAEQLLFLELVRRHRLKRFVRSMKQDGSFHPDDPWTAE